MDSVEISSILNTECGNVFVGVYSKDKIPNVSNLPVRNFPLCFVANTDDSSKPGEHWVAYYYRSNSAGDFFDSYSLPPDAYILPSTLITSHNTRQVQSFQSTVCGHYCIFYLIQRCLGRSVPQIMSYFSSNLESNDNYVGSFVKTRYAHCTRCLFNNCYCMQSCKSHDCPMF